MTPDKVFQILSGIGIASVLFWWISVIAWHTQKPGYRVSAQYQNLTIDELLSVALPIVGILLCSLSVAGTVVFSEYPPMTFIGFFLYTTVRFFSESRKNTSTVQEIPKPI